MHKIETIQTGEKKYWNILLCWPRFEPRASGVVLTDLYRTGLQLVNKNCPNQDGGKLGPCPHGSNH